MKLPKLEDLIVPLAIYAVTVATMLGTWYIAKHSKYQDYQETQAPQKTEEKIVPIQYSNPNYK